MPARVHVASTGRYFFRLDVHWCHPFPSRNGPTGLAFPGCPRSLSCISGSLRTIIYASMLSSLAVLMALSEGHSGFIVVVILVQGWAQERSLRFTPALSPRPQVRDHLPGGEGAEPDGLPAQREDLLPRLP